jgi:hypothetical protein
MRRVWIIGLLLGMSGTVADCEQSAAEIVTTTYRFIPNSSRAFQSMSGEGWPFRADLEGRFSLSYNSENGNALLTDYGTRLTLATKDHLVFPFLTSDPNGPAVAEARRQAALQQLGDEVNGTALADYTDWLSLTGTRQSLRKFNFGEILTELPAGASEWMEMRFEVYQPFYKDSMSAALTL